MKFKKGVQLARTFTPPHKVVGGKEVGYSVPVTKYVRKETISGMCKIYAYLVQELPYEPTITSIMDGKHMKGSLHYDGYAFDVRSWADSSGKQLSQQEKDDMAYNMRVILGKDWDVVVEGSHFHLEYQPEE